MECAKRMLQFNRNLPALPFKLSTLAQFLADKTQAFNRKKSVPFICFFCGTGGLK
jgi:hypothetical protein